MADPAGLSSNQGPWTARERMAGARAALEGAGIDHPDLLLSGIDDPEQAQLQTRRLLGVTVLRQDPVLLGRTAVELARSRMSTPAAPARHVVLPVHLECRGSGERPPPTERSVPAHIRSTRS